MGNKIHETNIIELMDFIREKGLAEEFAEWRIAKKEEEKDD